MDWERCGGRVWALALCLLVAAGAQDTSPQGNQVQPASLAPFQERQGATK